MSEELGLHPRAARRFHGRVEALERRTLLTNLPAGFTETIVASGLMAPTAMELAPDGRIFVTQQTGDLRDQGGCAAPHPVLTLDVNSSGERVVGNRPRPEFRQ